MSPIIIVGSKYYQENIMGRESMEPENFFNPFQKVALEFLKFFYLVEFSTD